MQHKRYKRFYSHEDYDFFSKAPKGVVSTVKHLKHVRYYTKFVENGYIKLPKHSASLPPLWKPSDPPLETLQLVALNLESVTDDWQGDWCFLGEPDDPAKLAIKQCKELEELRISFIDGENNYINNLVDCVLETCPKFYLLRTWKLGEDEMVLKLKRVDVYCDMLDDRALRGVEVYVLSTVRLKEDSAESI
ncbi:uncharacterized protein DFL_009017 [Arthrobotrys flagrans]|uniref:Uncharacterized protein n=1 Tax=Arthrobotrys flagrans TaxID=97331 RepID=A0A436ZQS5_ARTFL|nr:hypothetical protein DFL_009017 [Arthrobotrys flagrans]